MKNTKLLRYIITFFNFDTWQYLWNYWWGVRAMVSRKYERAICCFDKCLTFKNAKKTINLVYEHLGKCYFGINDIDKAKIYLMQSVDVNNAESVNSEVSSRLGFIFYQEGNFEKAKYYLEKAQRDYKKIDYTNIDAVNKYLIKVRKNN